MLVYVCKMSFHTFFSILESVTGTWEKLLPAMKIGLHILYKHHNSSVLHFPSLICILWSFQNDMSTKKPKVLLKIFPPTFLFSQLCCWVTEILYHTRNIIEYSQIHRIHGTSPSQSCHPLHNYDILVTLDEIHLKLN